MFVRNTNCTYKIQNWTHIMHDYWRLTRMQVAGGQYQQRLRRLRASLDED